MPTMSFPLSEESRSWPARDSSTNWGARSPCPLLSLIVTLAVVVGVVWLLIGRGPDVEDGSWLVLDLYGPVTEYAPPGDPFSQVVGGDPLTLQDMIDNLGKAAVDDRIAGVPLQDLVFAGYRDGYAPGAAPRRGQGAGGRQAGPRLGRRPSI